ncbi:hypothetical protein LCGC14_1212810 [marine sediment metagenome]|uniref:Uncharacterized protein n=1 Tax=marine sediment metagenome TaxID=412755 RepID=A0A0F9NVV6_9ZZZZ
METPTIDDTATRFSDPTWEVKINSVTNPKAVLANVSLSFGENVSSGTFSINEDPDTGTFPSYDDSVEIFVNGRRVIKGKIKGITSQITQSGLRKTFTVLTNITTLQEKVVDVKNKDFNETGTLEKDRFNAQQILNEILGYIPVGTPALDPGEIHLTDMTLLDAARTVVNRLGNFKLFWNQDTDLLELYEFGKGGDASRQFEKGVNILDLSITENRQNKVDKVTIIGPNIEERIRKIVVTTVEPDEDGVRRITFTINDLRPRNIVVEGSQRAQPTYEEQGQIQVLPEDMGIPALQSGPLQGFSRWPIFPLAEKIGNRRDDIGFRHPLKTLIIAPSTFSQITSQPQIIDKETVKVIVGQAPRIYFTSSISAFVDNKKVGIPGLGQTALEVLTQIAWFRGAIRVTYTRSGDCPQVSVGSGTVERTITDSQYQIIKDNIDLQGFDNEQEVLDLMQERADAEFKRLNRPNIGGTIAVFGDETVDLKNTLVVANQNLDIVRVVHNFDRGFITTVTVTNEIFFKAILRNRESDRSAARVRLQQRANANFKIGFDEVEVDQEKVTQKEEDFQKRLVNAGLIYSALQD